MSPNASSIRHYIALARPDHWVKHIFIVPGIVAAFALAPHLPVLQIFSNMVIGFISACLVASANYVLNEWLDAETDKNHPEKANRPSACGLVKPLYVYIEYAVLGVLGLLLAAQINDVFLIASVALFVSGITYNVKPIRTKDRVHFDVLSEAVNNPIRLLLGWAMVSSATIPPLSLLITYWAGGAFLMAAKRLSEYRYIVQEKGPEAPGLYRRSFRFYTVESLTLSCFVHALASTFGIAVFLIKYRSEFIFTFPLIIILFGYYLHLGLQPLSVAQKPEKLHRDWKLVTLVALLVISSVYCVFVDIPFIEQLAQSKFVEINLHAPE
ncbi:MAG: UbiA family prenyltransferase [Alphaproteobacteria bacterium]|nr:UbiA family prenyltransferase [Alphaproteobacteria bacterium]